MPGPEFKLTRRDFLKLTGATLVLAPSFRLDKVLSIGNDAGGIENDDLIELYDKKYAKQVERGYLDNVKPDTLAELYSGIIAKSGKLANTKSDKSVWVTDQLGRIFYERSPFLNKDQAGLWIQNRGGYDGLASGMSEAMLFIDLFPKDVENDLYTDVLIKSSDILTFTQGLKTRGLEVSDVIASPNRAPVNPDLTWTVPNNSRDFAFGDVIIVGERLRTGKPEIGVVTKADIKPDSTDVKITFFNSEGTENVKEIVIDTFTGLRYALGGAEFGVLRTKEINEMVQIRTLRNRFILDSAEIPEEIKSGKLGYHVDYKAIPEFADIKRRLIKAKSFKERGEMLMQAAALMGVQTRDDAENTQAGYIWNENDKIDKCNIYSTSLLRAIGLEDSISHWVLKDGTPAFNIGEELSAHGMNAWMVRFGPEYGWFPVTRMSKNQRLDLLRRGYIMYGARAGGIGDTIVVYGVEGESGKTLPVLTKASWNFMSTYPYRRYHFDDPMDYFKSHPEVIKSHPDADILWAHAVPGVERQKGSLDGK